MQDGIGADYDDMFLITNLSQRRAESYARQENHQGQDRQGR